MMIYPKEGYANLEAADPSETEKCIIFELWYENGLRYAALMRYFESGLCAILNPSELSGEYEVAEMVTSLARDGVQVLRTPAQDIIITLQ